jgi:hypothetical protein
MVEAAGSGAHRPVSKKYTMTATTIERSFACTTWDEWPHSEIEGGPKLARAHVTNRFDGGVVGTSAPEYLLLYVSETFGTFIGYERIEGTLDDRVGSFCLRQDGAFDTASISAELSIVDGTGTGDLAGISGTGSYRTIHGMAESAKITFHLEFPSSKS